jgi:hypothetical protein
MRLQASIDITLRFREAFKYIHGREGHGMKAQFCRNNNINNNQLNNLLAKPETRTLPPYYIACLCRDYGVSADWVLLGTGEIFKKSTLHEKRGESPDQPLPS